MSPETTASAAERPQPPPAARPEPARSLLAPRPGPPWIGWGVSARLIDLQWLLATLAMASWGLVFFGWRMLLLVAAGMTATLASFLLTRLLLRLARPGRASTPLLPALWLALLMTMCLPVTPQLWPAALAGGLLGVAANLVGARHRVRVHPVAVALSLLVVTAAMSGEPPSWWRGQAVLLPNRLVAGDLFHATTPDRPADWVPTVTGPDAVAPPAPGELLKREQERIAAHPRLLENLLLSGELPPMGRFLLGAVPGPAGASSPLLLIALGLGLIWRGLASWRSAAAGLIAAILVYLLLPLQTASGWTMLAAQLGELGPLRSFVYLGYVLLGSPLLLALLILAPLSEPISRAGRFAWGALVGAGVMLAFRLLPGAGWAFPVLVAAGLLVPWLDRLRLRRRFA
ncbi:MAG: RnfABCDGE type electron transport complex subunit D [Phycisphaeraceae bacterium]